MVDSITALHCVNFGKGLKVAALRAGDQSVAGLGAASRGVLHQHGPPGRFLRQQDEGAQLDPPSSMMPFATCCCN